MKYQCLLIDHDDTAVDSTPTVHHKAHIEQMRRLNREQQALSLQDWLKINYHPGLRSYMNDTLQLSQDEQALCYKIWREYTTSLTPPFFPGILPLLHKFRDAGGYIVVVSHSEADIIRSHYDQQKEIPGFQPDLIIGWNGDHEKNKPGPWPVQHTLRQFPLSPSQLLVVDDLKPGILMARNAGVDSAAVGWSHRLDFVKNDLAKLSTYYVETVSDLENILFTDA